MAFKLMAPKYTPGAGLEFVKNVLNCPYTVLGYSSPQQHELVKSIQNNDLRNQSELDIWNYWEQLWKNSSSFEEKNLPILFWNHPKNFEMAKKHQKKLLRWAHDLQCWAHSDGLSCLYSKLLEHGESAVSAELEKWNRSKNPWLRRQSIVSLLYYSKQRKKYPPLKRILTSVENLLCDEDYYVQKGVGWTLRETYNIKPQKCLGFIKKHLHRIHPDAYSAATEKIPVSEKIKLKQARKRLRTKTPKTT